MGNNYVDIILRAVDQASGNINKTTTSMEKLNAAFKSATGFSLGAAGGMAVAGMAIKKIVDYTKQAISSNVEYVSSITDMARVLGISSEETSRLVQLSDDLFISQEKLNTALLAASRQGIDVSVSGIKKLSEQYLSLAGGAERAQFVMKTFGRSGAEMGKLLEIGPEGISAGLAGIKDSLVVMAGAEAVVIAYKQSLDAVSDAYTGIANTVAQEVIPAMTTFNNSWAGLIESVEKSGFIQGAYNEILEGSSKAMYFWSAVLDKDLYKLLHYQEVMQAQNTVTKTAGEWVELLGVKTLAASTAVATFEEQMGAMDWKRAWTAITGEGAEGQQGLKSFDLLGDKLKELEGDGANIWNALLEATGQISPAAIEQFALVEAALQEIRTLSAQNIRIEFIVDYIIGKYPTLMPGGAAPAAAGAWVLKGTKGGEGTAKAWWNESTGSWYYGDTPPGMAGGGPVWGNKPYLVGEKGPEIIVPASNGTVIPNNQLGGSVVNFYGDANFDVRSEQIYENILRNMRIEV